MEKSKNQYDHAKESALLPSKLRGLISSKDVNALANYLGVSQQAINQYKIGASYPKTENLIKIAEFYGISIDYLLGFTETPNRDTSIQAANAVTGLSPGAIVKLHEMKLKHRGLVDVLSALIEDNNAAFFLSLMETLFSLESPDIEKEKVSMDISGKSLDLYQDNLLKAVLQTKLVENIPNVAKIYSVLTEEGGNNG